MAKTPFSLDTSPDVEERQVESWRAMSPADKAATVTALTRSAHAMMRAGIRQRHPGESPREHFLRAAIITLGPELACAAYPDAARLVRR